MSIETVAVILFALSAGAVVKGLSGLGLPLVAIPIMAGFIGVERAVALMVVPNVVTNCWLLWTYRRHALALPKLPWLVAAGVAGTMLGTWVLASVPERWLTILMAIWLGLYLLMIVFRLQPRLDGEAGQRLMLPVVGFGGVIQGATGAAGPVIGPYAHALGLRKGAYIFAVTMIFSIFTLTQIGALLWYDLLTEDRFYEGLVACIPPLVVLPLATRLAGRFSPRAFEWTLMAVFLAMEARLIYRIFA